MTVSTQTGEMRWVLLVFSLPAKQASERVDIWRKLKRFGVLGLKSSGYVLPRTPQSEERLQWLATQIRKHHGEASVLQVEAFDNLSTPELVRMFNDARNREYEPIGAQLRKLGRAKTPPAGAIPRLRRRFDEIRERDFFEAPAGRRVEQQFAILQRRDATAGSGPRRRKDYSGRTWVTRPRPGIDRVSSAWLIRRFIDPSPTFAFGNSPDCVPGAVPFDMFTGKGFSHMGDECTFETLVRQFDVADPKVTAIARSVHDADLADEKYGRTEALVIELILSGWANQSVSDDELLRRGMEMIEGLYHAS